MLLGDPAEVTFLCAEVAWRAWLGVSDSLVIPLICELLRKPDQTEPSVESQPVLYSAEAPLGKE